VAHKTSSKSGGAGRTTTKSMKKSTSRRTKAGAKQEAGDVTVVAEDEVAIDRRRSPRRDEVLGYKESATQATPMERRKKVNRRRQIDPTTCERDYTDQEVEFMNALDDYKRKSGRMFPTCSEVLEVLRGIGYVKLSAAEMGSVAVETSSAASAKPMPSDWSSTIEEEADADFESQLA
jgi:hypothetical protein